MTIAAQHVRAAINHLRGLDSRWRDIIRQVGPFAVRLERDPATWLTCHLHRTSLLELLAAAAGPAQPLSGTQLRFHAELQSAIDRGQIDLSLPPSPATWPIRTAELAQLLRRFDSRLLPNFLFFCWGHLDQWPAADPPLSGCVTQLWPPATATLRQASIDSGKPPQSDLAWPVDTWAPFRSVAAWYLTRWVQLNLPATSPVAASARVAHPTASTPAPPREADPSIGS
jgi:hypothetical protein